MNWYWILIIAIVSYGGLFTGVYFINKYENRQRKEFWNKYFELIEKKSEMIKKERGIVEIIDE